VAGCADIPLTVFRLCVAPAAEPAFAFRIASSALFRASSTSPTIAWSVLATAARSTGADEPETVAEGETGVDACGAMDDDRPGAGLTGDEAGGVN